jgi:hypothetical protein
MLMAETPYTLADLAFEGELIQFLAWLNREEKIQLIKDEGRYRRGVYKHEHGELTERYLEWHKNRSSS